MLNRISSHKIAFVHLIAFALREEARRPEHLLHLLHNLVPPAPHLYRLLRLLLPPSPESPCIDILDHVRRQVHNDTGYRYVT